MSEEEFVIKFYSCDNEEQFLKDIYHNFNCLKKENQELKLQLKGTTHCFDEEEHEKLKKQVEEYKDKINWYENFEVNKTIDKLRLKHNTQQKEFILYLRHLSNWYSADGIKQGMVNGILQKYKEIIGVSDEKK